MTVKPVTALWIIPSICQMSYPGYYLASYWHLLTHVDHLLLFLRHAIYTVPPPKKKTKGMWHASALKYTFMFPQVVQAH